MKTTFVFILFTTCAVFGTRSFAEPSGPSAVATSSDKDFGLSRPSIRLATNITRIKEWETSAPPEKIFPLLCPTREYDWIPTWRARMIHSESGFAEENCIFETRSSAYGATTWVCTRFEPATQIEYTMFAEIGCVMRLKIVLEPTPAGTRLRWTRSWLATSASGEQRLKEWDESAYDKSIERLRSELDYYLQTGTALTR